MSDKTRSLISILIVLGLVVLTIYLIFRDKPRDEISDGSTSPVHIDTIEKEDKAKTYPPAVEITNPSGYINTDEISIKEHIGKNVILLDFWTYSCINCQRTFPYIKQWHEKYKDEGLVIIGIHTPEFDFEKIYENVLDATKRFGIEYPVVMDNDYSIWKGYENNYWPRKYLIDIDGFIVYDHIGEGGYDATEMKIQELLEERKLRLGLDTKIDGKISTPENVEKVDLRNPRTPETYFGSLRNNSLGNGKQGASGIQTFVSPVESTLDILYFEGQWDVQPEFAENLNKGDKIILKYRAEKVFLVASSEKGSKMKILKDGEELGEDAGRDVESDSSVNIQNEQLYRLIEDTEYGEHLLEITIEDSGFKAFAFTFG